MTRKLQLKKIGSTLIVWWLPPLWLSWSTSSLRSVSSHCPTSCQSKVFLFQKLFRWQQNIILSILPVDRKISFLKLFFSYFCHWQVGFQICPSNCPVTVSQSRTRTVFSACLFEIISFEIKAFWNDFLWNIMTMTLHSLYKAFQLSSSLLPLSSLSSNPPIPTCQSDMSQRQQ